MYEKRISFFMSSWEIYSFRLVMESCRGEFYKEAILVFFFFLLPVWLESFNISFISIIKINGHLLVNFLIGTPFKIAIIYDLYQGAIWKAIYIHLIISLCHDTARFNFIRATSIMIHSQAKWFSHRPDAASASDNIPPRKKYKNSHDIEHTTYLHLQNERQLKMRN